MIKPIRICGRRKGSSCFSCNLRSAQYPDPIFKCTSCTWKMFFFVYLEWYIIRTLCPMSVSTAEPAYVGRLRKLSSPYFTTFSFSRVVQVHALPGMSKNSSSEQIYDTCQNFNATILRRQAYSHVGGQCILSYIYKMFPGHVLSDSAR